MKNNYWLDHSYPKELRYVSEASSINRNSLNPLPTHSLWIAYLRNATKIDLIQKQVCLSALCRTIFKVEEVIFPIFTFLNEVGVRI